jgi:archaeosortase B (VPXXXP-CTERM-specific)
LTGDDPELEGAGAPPEGPAAGGGAFARLRGFWRVPTYRFASSFLAFLVVLSFGYPWFRERFGFVLLELQRGTALVIHYALRLLRIDTEVAPNEPVVFLDGFPVKIVEECTGLYEALLLSAALLAYPTSWGKTFVGFGLGFSLIYLLNVVRIIVLMAVGRWAPDAFDFMHIYFWQVTMILMVVMVLYVWVRWVVRDEAPRGS